MADDFDESLDDFSEFADEDRDLAEEGMTDYLESLRTEDEA